MSTVRLQAFAVLKSKAQIGSEKNTGEMVPLCGASDTRVNADDKCVDVLLDSVPFRLDSITERAKNLSRNRLGLFFLYGIRDSLAETSFWSSEARKNDSVLTTAEFEYEVGAIYPNLVDRKTIREFRNESGASIRFANVSRMKREMLLDVLAKFQQFIKEEGGKVDQMATTRDMATRPDLWVKVLESDQDLKQIDILVVPVADLEGPKSHSRQVAWVRPGTKIVSTMQSRTDIRLLNPSWMLESATR